MPESQFDASSGDGGRGAYGQSGPDGGPLLLLVDDEPTILLSLGRLLRLSGYRVRTADSGQEALARVRTERFDAVICDLRLPDVEGAELFERLWQTDPSLVGRVVLTSGDLDTPGAAWLVHAAGVPALTKPFASADLLRTLAAICPAPAARERRAAS